MNLKKCRTKRGLTQKEVANALGVKSNAVSQWETGQREPSIINLKKLAKLYECTLEDLTADDTSVTAN